MKEVFQFDSFKFWVMSSFVCNCFIDKVYLFLFGDNFVKQMGMVGEQICIDCMGLLLLLFFFGYGKIMFMEYIVNCLGFIFMKINGLVIGYQVIFLVLQDVNSMVVVKELEKLNLALEMGDNVMFYVDDIQYCYLEFLQKFIFFCDVQCCIEGVYKGKVKIYDLWGSCFVVVMVGNFYIESGDCF